MIDAKAVAKEAADVVRSRSGACDASYEAMKTVFEAAINAAQSPEPKKTRGQEVAEKCVHAPYADSAITTLAYPDPLLCQLRVLIAGETRPAFCSWLAALLDSEIANARKSEREQIATYFASPWSLKSSSSLADHIRNLPEFP